MQFSALGQKGSLSANVDKNAILIGEQLQFTIQSFVPGNKSIHFPIIDSIAHFYIISKSRIDTQIVQGGIGIQQKFLLTSWDSGKWTIPSFSYQAFKTKPIVVTVSYSSFDPQQPYHDIKDIINVTKPVESNWWWYLVGILFLAALFFLFFPSAKKQPPAAIPVMDENIYKETIKKLENLKSGQLQEKDISLFYTTLIDIFRNYLEKRKNISSFSKTTDDLSLRIKSLNISSEEYNSLVSALQLSDFVKYARYKPGSEENKIAINSIENSVVAIEKT
jgi:hypothetical protein